MEERIDEYINSLLGLVEFLRSLKKEETHPQPLRSKVVDRTNAVLRKLLFHESWPTAVTEEGLCDPHSDFMKMVRSESIINQIVDRDIHRLNILDFGCGEGHGVYATLKHNPRFSVGYDIKSQGWDRFTPQPGFLLTTDMTLVRHHAPYDIIMLHDVLDHIEGSPVEILADMRDLLSDKGAICLRTHPFSSRHGGHTYPALNKAFCHLLFSEDELKIMGGIVSPSQRVIKPLSTYRSWFRDAGLQLQSERAVYGEVDNFFKTPKISKMIADFYGEDQLPEEHLRVSFVDYVVSK